MNRGCCLGCFAFLMLIVALLGGAVYFVLEQADVFSEAPAIALEQFLPADPALRLHLDPNHPEFVSIFSQALDLSTPQYLLKALPRKLAVTLRPDRDHQLNELVIAMNTRRFGGGLDWLSQHVWPAESWEWFPRQRLTWVGEDRRGLFSIRSEIPFNEASLDEVERWWAGAARTPLSPEGDHIVELLLDNQDGGLMLALTPLLVESTVDPDEIVVMKAPFDLEHAGRLPGLFRRLTTLRLTADLPEADRCAIHLHARCRDPEAAEGLLFFCFTLRDLAYRQCVEQDIRLESAFRVAGAEVFGDFTITNFRQQLVNKLAFMLAQ